MLVYEGQTLLGSQSAHGILNGVMYQVLSVSNKCVLADGDREVSLSTEILGKVCRLCHAMTIFSSQSRTLQGVVRICMGPTPGVVHRAFTRNLLLVAASRCTSIDKLIIE